MIGEEFAEAWSILMILSIGCLINAVLQLVEIPLTYMRPYVNVLGCLGAIMAYLLCVTAMQNQFGMKGIAMTSVTAALLSNLVLLIDFARSKLHPA